MNAVYTKIDKSKLVDFFSYIRRICFMTTLVLLHFCAVMNGCDLTFF